MKSTRNTLRALALAATCLLAFNLAAVADDNPAAELPPSGPFGAYSQLQGSYLGIDPQDITQQQVNELKLKETRGVEVMMVDQDAPAGKAGIKEHDVILEFNHVPVQSVAQLKRLLQETPAGRTVEVGLSRDGQMQTVQVTLASKMKALQAMRAWQPPERLTMAMPAPPAVAFPDVSGFEMFNNLSCGLAVENLSPQLGDYFGVKRGRGILVRSVEKGSAAESAGFHAGDVILQVGSDVVNDPGDLAMAMRHYQNRSVKVSIMRERRVRTLQFKVPQDSLGLPSGDLFGPKMEQKLQEILKQIPAQKIAMRDLQKQIDDVDWSAISRRAMQQAQQALAQSRVQEALAQLPKQELALHALQQKIAAIESSQAEQRAVQNAQRALQELQQTLEHIH